MDDGDARPAQRSQTGGQQKPSANHFNQLDDDEEEAAVLPQKKSAPAPADEEDEDGAEVMPAVPVPSKPKGPTKGPAKKAGAK